MRPQIAWQGSLLDSGEPRLDLSFARLVRHRLDDCSWVDHVPGWLAGSDELFAAFLDSSRWEQREMWMYDKVVAQPRLTAGWKPDDSDPETPEPVRQMVHALSERYGVAFDSVWVNLYRDGSDSVAWHGDRNAKTQRNPLVATISLGAARKFQMRRNGTSKITHVFDLGHGDLLVMGGACQHDWEHTVPKVAKALGPRMSVTIRHGGDGPT